MEGLVMAAVLALTAVGLSLVFGVMRVVNVAHGEFFMLGAVLAWACASLVPHPLGGFAAALVVAPLVVGAVGILLERTMLQRLYKLDHLYGLLLTFGFALVMLCNWIVRRINEDYALF
jgi:branched-chain amino acid transport system permease protein